LGSEQIQDKNEQELSGKFCHPSLINVNDGLIEGNYHEQTA
jgi:hypothetical protein